MCKGEEGEEGEEGEDKVVPFSNASSMVASSSWTTGFFQITKLEMRQRYI